VHAVSFPGWVDELTDAQRAALEPAHFYDRPVIAPDGAVSRFSDDYNSPQNAGSVVLSGCH